MTNDEVLAARRRFLGGNISVGYRRPLQVVRGAMQYLFDDAGRRYIDAYNNVPHVGHCHPRVVEAAAGQLRALNTNTRYLDEHLARFAERLADTLPEPLRICYFVNSGSEANELALRLARAHTRQRDLIVLDAAYHGNTTTLIDVSPYKFNGPGGNGKPPWVHVVPIPDVYRGKHRSAGDTPIGAKYADAVAQSINGLRAAGAGLCGFIAEAFVVLAAFNFDWRYAVLAASAVILTAGYILWTLQRGLGRTVCRKITGQALAHAPLAQCRTEVLPVMGDFIGEIAGKFKTRDRPVHVQDGQQQFGFRIFGRARTDSVLVPNTLRR
jgi:hypothetical protein